MTRYGRFAIIIAKRNVINPFSFPSCDLSIPMKSVGSETVPFPQLRCPAFVGPSCYLYNLFHKIVSDPARPNSKARSKFASGAFLFVDSMSHFSGRHSRFASLLPHPKRPPVRTRRPFYRYVGGVTRTRRYHSTPRRAASPRSYGCFTFSIRLT